MLLSDWSRRTLHSGVRDKRCNRSEAGNCQPNRGDTLRNPLDRHCQRPALPHRRRLQPGALPRDPSSLAFSAQPGPTRYKSRDGPVLLNYLKVTLLVVDGLVHGHRVLMRCRSAFGGIGKVVRDPVLRTRARHPGIPVSIEPMALARSVESSHLPGPQTKPGRSASVPHSAPMGVRHGPPTVPLI